MLCDICKQNYECHEIIAPPINAKEWSKEVFNINNAKWIYVGKLPPHCNKEGDKPIKNMSDVDFYRFWAICADCKPLFLNRGRLDLPFKMNKESKEKILKKGVDSHIINQKELDFVKTHEAWRNRRAYRKNTK